jgi:predicted phage-related endonuclease
MPITPEQRKRRRERIRSSDPARIMEISPYGGPLDVFVEKCGDETADSPTDAMQTGNRLEGPIGEFMAERLGVKLIQNVEVDAGDGVNAAAIDFTVEGPNPEKAVEAKAVSGQHRDLWGADGTDQIPDHTLMQCSHQMLCLPSLKVVHVGVAWIHNNGIEWRHYHCERNDQLIELIRASNADFWAKHILPRIPPAPGSGVSLETLKRLPRLGKSMPVAADLLLRHTVLSRLEGKFKKAKEAALGDILKQLGDGRICDTGTDTVRGEWKTVNATQIDRDGLRRDGLLEKYTRSAPYDRLFVKLPKKADPLRLLLAQRLNPDPGVFMNQVINDTEGESDE